MIKIYISTAFFLRVLFLGGGGGAPSAMLGGEVLPLWFVYLFYEFSPMSLCNLAYETRFPQQDLPL